MVKKTSLGRTRIGPVAKRAKAVSVRKKSSSGRTRIGPVAKRAKVSVRKRVKSTSRYTGRSRRRGMSRK